MAAVATTSASSKTTGAGSNPEQVLAGLNVLRGEQRSMATKLSELQMDLNEHKLVIETLEGVEKDRKCFRMVGGVLVERKVGEVEPALTSNRDKMAKLIETLEKQLSEKGQDINAYMEKHNIQVRGAGNQKKELDQSKEAGASTDSKSTGVLVN